MHGIKKVRLAIASDKAITLRGLRSMILSWEPADLIGEAHTGAEAIQLSRLSPPDIILVDLHQDEDTKITTINQILDVDERIHLVVFEHQGEATQKLENQFGLRLFCLPRNVSEADFFDTLVHLNQIIEENVNPSRISLHSVDEDESADEQDDREPLRQARSGELLSRELVMAGKIQADILPEVVPSIKGWDIAARLIPARETSGDFYDFIPLNDRKMGIVVADVTDKGMGAALFMALSSTLLRTYAYRFPTLPGLTLKAVSDRILSDTRGSMFVTSIFGVLEPHTGRFVYANAGHPPGFRITTQKGHQSIQALKTTGMALGVSEQSQWKQKETRLDTGDILILYTDGVIEAQNQQGDFFEEERLLDAVLSVTQLPSANLILDTLLQTVHNFVGTSQRQDDIAMIIIRRE